MNRVKHAILSLLVAAMLIGWAGPIKAASITFNLNTVFSGDIPPGTQPWLSLTVEDTAANTVRLTFSTDPGAAGSTGGQLTGTAFVDEWYFNSDVTLSASSFTFVSASSTGPAATGIAVQFPTASPCTGSGLKSDGDGCHNVKFTFETSSSGDRFTAGEKVVYTATTDGLNALDFDKLGTWPV